MRNVRTKISAALHDTYSHREGEHDDLLLALACAVWAAEHSAYATSVVAGLRGRPMGKKKSLYERRQQAGREGMAVRLYGLDAAGRRAMIAPAHEAVRRRCEAAALAEFRSRGEVPTTAELAARTDEVRLEWCRAMGRKGAEKARALAANATP